MHRLTYISVFMDGILMPRVKPNGFTRWFASLVQSIECRVTPFLLKGFVLLGLARKVDVPDEKTVLLAKMLWEDATRRSIPMWEFRLFNLARNVYVAELPDGRSIAFEGIPVTKADLKRAPWMDDKAELKKRFRALGLPIAAGGDALTTDGALKLFRSLSAPVIVKPFTGSASRHTTLHIRNDLELLRAFDIATQLAPRAVIEEELVGPVYRATVVDGKLAATLRRDQPHVIGDGHRTVKSLVAKANEHPARSGPYFHPMQIDKAAERELAYQGLTPDSILKKGQRATLHQKINWGLGGTTADVTDEVHPETKELFEEVARVTSAPVVGIDFIIGDITRSYKEQERCGIIECNSMPFFDNHHLPFEGQPRNVAGAIWDMILAEGR